MAFDLKRSTFSDRKEWPTPSTVTIAEMGQALVWIADPAGSGASFVTPSTGASAEVPAGFAITDAIKRTTETVIDVLVIPSAPGPYTVTLSNSNLEFGVIGSNLDSISIVGSVTGTLTQDTEGTSLPPASGHYQVTTHTTGIVTFAAAQAGETATIQYRHILTLAQINAKYQQRSVNNTANDTFHTVSVGCGEGFIYTDQYDTAQVYVLNQAVKTAGHSSGSTFVTADGRVSNGGTGTALGIVIKLPSSGGDGYLGVKYNIPQ